MRTKTVIFIAPRLLKSSELPQDILLRFNEQANLAKSLNPDSNVTFLFFFTSRSRRSYPAFTNFPQLSIFNSLDFDIFPLFMFLNIIRKTWKIRKSDIMLVTGDISVGLPLTIIISKYFLPNSRVQLAIHGDPFSSRKNSIKKVIQIFLFKHFIASVDIFRLVSQHLEYLIFQFLGQSRPKIIVSPIPIQMIPEIDNVRIVKTIGFVGRLHDERGVEEWCTIVQSLENQPPVSLVVIGNGPLEAYMKSKIPKITFFGALSRKEVLKSFSKISVLLSCAENEGYGLAIREAVLHGTFVVAKKNPSTILLKNNFPEAVSLYTTKEEAILLLKTALDRKLNREQILTFRKLQRALDAESSARLVNSWLID